MPEGREQQHLKGLPRDKTCHHTSCLFGKGQRGSALMVLPLTYFYLPKSARAHLFSQSVKQHIFAAAPLVLTPFVRNQFIEIWEMLVLFCSLCPTYLPKTSDGHQGAERVSDVYGTMQHPSARHCATPRELIARRVASRHLAPPRVPASKYYY